MCNDASLQQIYSQNDKMNQYRRGTAHFSPTFLEPLGERLITSCLYFAVSTENPSINSKCVEMIFVHTFTHKNK